MKGKRVHWLYTAPPSDIPQQFVTTKVGKGCIRGEGGGGSTVHVPVRPPPAPPLPYFTYMHEGRTGMFLPEFSAADPIGRFWPTRPRAEAKSGQVMRTIWRWISKHKASCAGAAQNRKRPPESVISEVFGFLPQYLNLKPSCNTNNGYGLDRRNRLPLVVVYQSTMKHASSHIIFPRYGPLGSVAQSGGMDFLGQKFGVLITQAVRRRVRPPPFSFSRLDPQHEREREATQA